MTYEYREHDQLLDSVVNAGRHAGHAAAMAINLQLAGSVDRASVWETEHKAWEERIAAVVSAGVLKRQLDEAGQAAFISSFEGVYVQVSQTLDAVDTHG